MWPTLTSCDGLALSPFTPICHRAWLSQDVPLEPFRSRDTCKETIDLDSEAKRTPWTVPWMSTSDLHRHSIPTLLLSCARLHSISLL